MIPQLSERFDRSQGIGASEAGAALGLSRFVSPYALWARKTGRLEDAEQTAAMEWGLRLQDPILGAYSDRLTDPSLAVRRNSATKPLKGQPIFATTDGFLVRLMAGGGYRRVATIDAKAPRSSDGWGDDGTSEVPPDYYVQAQLQALVTGLPRCDLAVLFHGSDFRVYPIDANPADQRLIVVAVVAWWDTHVVADVAPDITAPSESNDRALLAVFGQGGAGDLAPTPELVAMVDRLALAWTNRKQAQDGYDLAKQQVMAVMGDHDRLVAPAATVTWSRGGKETPAVAWDQVARSYRALLDEVATRRWSTADLDAIVSLYTTTKVSSPRFTVKLSATSTED